MSGQLFDTNVLLDIATADAVWLIWSEEQLRQAALRGPILINPIVYAELAPAVASQAFLKYRHFGGTKSSPLPDFYIGAHAESAGLTLVTRDDSR